MKRLFPLLVGILALAAFRFPPPKKIKVYLIGDSTLSVKEKRAYPETGWGMPFVHFFDSSVVIDNRAKNGRSTRTFLEEGLWRPVAESLEPGDYVFIQFGHNDEVETKKSYTAPAEFTALLLRYVQETRAKGAFPVLITPAARRKFDTTGRVEGTHEVYSGLVREAARQAGVPLIDLDRSSQALLQGLGVEGSRLLFNHLEPGEHPNYPDGKKDDTHFNELGARKMAQLVLSAMKDLKLDLVRHIRSPYVKS